MKLGIFTVLFSELNFDDMLRSVSSEGIEAVELETGGYPGDAHCKLDELLGDADKQKSFKQKISDHGLIISALSCHANLDPSHMWWQGIDPVEAIKILGREDAIHHFHAKDTIIDQQNVNNPSLK